MSDTKHIKVFNADLQRETDHTVDIDGNGEIVVTCVENGRFLKFPAGTTPEQLKELLSQHKDANAGQITQESIEAKRAEILAAFDTPAEAPADAGAGL